MKAPLLTLLLPLLAAGAAYGEGPKYKIVRPRPARSPAQLELCCADAERLSARLEKLGPKGLLALYRAEECLISFLHGPLRDYEEREASLTPASRRALKYFKAHRDRFTDPPAEGDFVKRETAAVIPDRLASKFPGSAESWTVRWEREYRAFMDRFGYDHKGQAKGKTCAAYYESYIKGHKEILETYSKEEIAAQVADCEADRAEYKKGLGELLERYRAAPIVPELYDPDETNIISSEYFGIC